MTGPHEHDVNDSGVYILSNFGSNVRSVLFSRMSLWLWATLAIKVFLNMFWGDMPVDIQVGVSKITLLTAGAWLGYWIDRTIFPYARPHSLPRLSPAYSTAQLRRAVIVSAAILGIALGV